MTYTLKKSPCGESVIELFKGADSTELQEMRTKLLVFLKGSKRKKLILEAQHPLLYKQCLGCQKQAHDSFSSKAVHLFYDMLLG